MTSLSFLDIIAADESDQRLASRKTVVSASQRIDDRFGAWLRVADSKEDFNARVSYVAEDIRGIIVQAAQEHGVEGETFESYFETIVSRYAPKLDEAVDARVASVHEARKIKMCPWHKDVVDISLAAGDPRAGFDSMAQHWGGPRHCEGEGYEGSKCNFKAPMTTQSWWDDRAEAAEQKKRDRAEQAQGDEIIEEPIAEGDEITEPVDTGDTIIEEPVAEDNVVDVDFGGGSTNGEEPTAEEIPMSMAAASTKEADMIKEAPGKQHLPGASPKRNRQYEHIKQQYIEDGLSEEEAAERAARTVNKQRSEHGETKGSSKTADDNGFGGPEPTIDKRKWTPQTVPFLDVDKDDGPNPTKRKDIVEPIKPTNGTDRFSPSKLEEVGEQNTEHQDVAESVDYAKTEGQSATWTAGPSTAVSSTLPDDIHKNPIKAIMEGEYDGFLPAHTVQQALASHRK
jgi:hypothetical protein